jgi:hypothetical protein
MSTPCQAHNINIQIISINTIMSSSSNTSASERTLPRNGALHLVLTEETELYRKLGQTLQTEPRHVSFDFENIMFPYVNCESINTTSSSSKRKETADDSDYSYQPRFKKMRRSRNFRETLSLQGTIPAPHTEAPCSNQLSRVVTPPSSPSSWGHFIDVVPPETEQEYLNQDNSKVVDASETIATADDNSSLLCNNGKQSSPLQFPQEPKLKRRPLPRVRCQQANSDDPQDSFFLFTSGVENALEELRL